MRRTLLRSAAFVRDARRVAKKGNPAAAALHVALTQLEADAFAPVLKTHKLKGDLAGSYACSAGYDLRIVFEIVEREGAEVILLQSVGTHDEVY